jgi:hypothetical protein
VLLARPWQLHIHGVVEGRKDMLFIFGFAFVGLVISLTGLLMFAFPTKYVGIANWYFSKVGFGKPASIEKYARWPYRVSGLLLFLASFLIFYEFSVQLEHFLR